MPDKIQRLRQDIDALDKKLMNVANAYNRFVAEQEEFNAGVEKNMQVIYDAFVKPEIERQEKAKKNIIVPGGN